MEIGLAALNWSAPWMQPWRDTGQGVAQQVQDGAALHDALNTAGATPGSEAGIPKEAGIINPRSTCALHLPIQFVAQEDLPAGMAYEQFVFEARRCPVRPGLHDFFNGLCWLQFAQTKARLNKLQAGEIAKAGVQPVRGALRDALTLFDENAALLDAPEPLWQALSSKDWHKLFIELRPLWQQATLLLFGHALLEKLATPRKAITAHVWCLAPGLGARGIEAIDAWLAADLQAEKLRAKPFAALPVLGVPGWWAPNEDPAFYDDASVFRSPTQSRKQHVPSGGNA